ncbi:H-2 class II histocompatibility antigen, A-U alpha chain [Carassius auratus]|uniref:H-2 class II histocompatibility antigen, A-U alpha chain n=1 Tax=Carassius auratus TaxID=7957 RepID=A0A6P6MUB2_CARAU|nr:H-2 class II histocompatibility antigen, A-U alpha chain-like [Carassius auratus]
MEMYGVLLLLAVIVSIETQVVHRDVQFTGCSDTEKEFLIGFDGEELWHADFIRKEGVVTLPDFADPVSFPGFYEAGLSNIEVCKQNLAQYIKLSKPTVEQLAPPDASIYSEDDVVLGVENALICLVTGLFPPPVNVSWTKNNQIVTEDVSLSQYRRKNDGTFNIFSSLRFTPAEGDIYSCTVYHKALERRGITKTWEVDVAVPGIGPAVFCGVGLSLGLLGVAAGTFFLIKGNNCN